MMKPAPDLRGADMEPGDEWCFAVSESGFLCNAKKGHEGEAHAAYSFDADPVCVWEDDEEE